MTQAIALHRKLEPWFADLSNRFINLSIVLRVDGSIDSFGRPGVESIHDDSGTIVCDLVIEDLGWDDLSDTGIYRILVDRVLDAVGMYLQPFDADILIAELRAVAEMRGSQTNAPESRRRAFYQWKISRRDWVILDVIRRE